MQGNNFDEEFINDSEGGDSVYDQQAWWKFENNGINQISDFSPQKMD